MRVHSAWVAVAALGIIVLVLSSLFVVDPMQRTVLALASVVPLLYVTAQLSREYKARLASERRRYSKLRYVTDEFIIGVRNLNRLTVLEKSADAPDNADEMIDEVVQRMRKTVDRIVEAAGIEDQESG